MSGHFTGPEFKVISDERAHQTNMSDFAKGLMSFFAEHPGVWRFRAVVVCCDCDKRWERKVSMRDKKLPEAFDHLMREAQLHAGLYEHKAINLRLESLS
jgi:hypothetical protein